MFAAADVQSVDFYVNYDHGYVFYVCNMNMLCYNNKNNKNKNKKHKHNALNNNPPDPYVAKNHSINSALGSQIMHFLL